MASPGEALVWGQEREKGRIAELGWSGWWETLQSSHSLPTFLILLQAALGTKVSTGFGKNQAVAQEGLGPGLRTPPFPLNPALSGQAG